MMGKKDQFKGELRRYLCLSWTSIETAAELAASLMEGCRCMTWGDSCKLQASLLDSNPTSAREERPGKLVR